MVKLRPAQMLSPAKKLTKEELRKNPFLRRLIIERLKEIKSIRAAGKATELDLD